MREQFVNIPLRKNEAKKRFELEIDGNFAFIDYRETNNQIALVHTEVDPALNGLGAAAAVVEKTLKYIEEANITLMPYCPYVFAYIQKHPEWKRIVDKSFGGYDKL